MARIGRRSRFRPAIRVVPYGFIPNVIPRSVSDNALASDSIASIATHPRSIADSALASDSLARVSTRSRSIADTATASDSVTRFTSHAFFKSISDSAIASDSIASRTAYHPRSPNDSAQAIDSVIRIARNARSISDFAFAADTVASSVYHPTAPTHPAPSIVFLTTRGGRRIVAMGSSFIGSMSVVDTATASETVTRAATHPRSIADSSTASDSVARTTAHTFIKLVSDSAIASDAITFKRLVQSRTVADSATSFGSPVGVGRYSRSISDSAVASDSISIITIHSVQTLNTNHSIVFMTTRGGRRIAAAGISYSPDGFANAPASNVTASAPNTTGTFGTTSVAYAQPALCTVSTYNTTSTNATQSPSAFAQLTGCYAAANAPIVNAGGGFNRPGGNRYMHLIDVLRILNGQGTARPSGATATITQDTPIIMTGSTYGACSTRNLVDVLRILNGQGTARPAGGSNTITQDTPIIITGQTYGGCRTRNLVDVLRILNGQGTARPPGASQTITQDTPIILTS